MATSLSTRNGNIGVNLLTTPASVVSAAKLKYPLHSKECSHCRGHAPFFLHQVKQAGIFRRLCTACVLHLHRTSFCPACFVFYAGSLPAEQVPCSNCPFVTHSHCAGNNLLSSYLCQTCKDSKFSFFPFKDNKIDKKLASALLYGQDCLQLHEKCCNFCTERV